jgi:hypothetical protein
MPLKDGDPLTGPLFVVDLAKQWMEKQESRSAAMIAGVLMLGDARILPHVTGIWRQLERVMDLVGWGDGK